MSLQALLDSRGISKYRLSKMSGVSKTVVADICSGKSSLENCTAKTVYRIALVLDCTVEFLLMMSAKSNIDNSAASDQCEVNISPVYSSERNLKKYGIDFYVEKSLENDLFALIDGVNNNVSYIDCLRDELLSSVHASYNAGLLSVEQAEFIEQNFIFSNRGILHG